MERNPEAALSDRSFVDPARRQFVRSELKRGILKIRPVGPSIGQREAPIILDEVRQTIRSVGRDMKVLVIDLGDVSFLSSMGLGMCIDLRNQAGELNAKTILFGLKPQIAQIFRMMRLERLYSIARTEEELHKLAA